MATHSSVLARRIPGTGEPGGLPLQTKHPSSGDNPLTMTILVVTSTLPSIRVAQLSMDGNGEDSACQQSQALVASEVTPEPPQMWSCLKAESLAIGSARLSCEVGLRGLDGGEAPFCGARCLSWHERQQTHRSKASSAPGLHRVRLALEGPLSEGVRPCDSQAALPQPWFQGLPALTQQAARNQGWGAPGSCSSSAHSPRHWYFLGQETPTVQQS